MSVGIQWLSAQLQFLLVLFCWQPRPFGSALYILSLMQVSGHVDVTRTTAFKSLVVFMHCMYSFCLLLHHRTPCVYCEFQLHLSTAMTATAMHVQ